METIGVWGGSLLMSSIGATLEQAGWQVVQVDPQAPDPVEQLHGLSPRAVLYDVAHAPIEFLLRLLGECPDLRLIGVDLDHDCMLVLSGRQPRLFTKEDILQVIQADAQENSYAGG